MPRYVQGTLIAAVLVLLAACTAPSPTPPPDAASEQPVATIPLAGPVSQPHAEVSGLAWYGDHLILLPQYPNFDSRQGDGFVYALDSDEILAYLGGEVAGPLEPTAIPFVAPGLAGQIDGFEGYEAIAFDGERAYLTIEASPGSEMRGYLVSGIMATDLSALTLDTATIVEILPQSGSGNKSDEALLVTGDSVLTIYEVNGAALNSAPVAHRFDRSLAPTGTVAFPNIEYRVTDATALDEEDRFWAINYFFPLDRDLLPDAEPLASQYGQGASHQQHSQVERLVEFEYSEAGISLAGSPPLQLELPGRDARNWEGIVRLDGRGFLLVTDKFPETILGFVAWPQKE